MHNLHIYADHFFSISLRADKIRSYDQWVYEITVVLKEYKNVCWTDWTMDEYIRLA